MFTLLISLFLFNLFVSHSIPTDYEALQILNDDGNFDSAENLDLYDIEIANEPFPDGSDSKVIKEYKSLTEPHQKEDNILMDDDQYEPLTEPIVGDYKSSGEDDELNQQLDQREYFYEPPKETEEYFPSEPTIGSQKPYYESQMEPINEDEYVIPSYVDMSYDPKKKEFLKKHSRSATPRSKSQKNSENFIKNSRRSVKDHGNRHYSKTQRPNPEIKNRKSLFLFGPVTVNISEMKIKV